METEPTLSPRQLNRTVLARQLLLQRSRLSLPQVLETIGGIQAQYAPSMYIGLWSRVEAFERDDLTAVRFLPTWDATLLVHAQRAAIILEEDRERVFHVRNPQSEATFLVDGVVAGSWVTTASALCTRRFARWTRGLGARSPTRPLASMACSRPEREMTPGFGTAGDRFEYRAVEVSRRTRRWPERLQGAGYSPQPRARRTISYPSAGCPKRETDPGVSRPKHRSLPARLSVLTAPHG